MAAIAIIGHGRSAEGKRWRGHIDHCDLVVRMWDWQWQAPDDYGTKYDFGLFEIAAGQMERFYKFNKRQPRRGWLASFLWRPGNAVTLPAKTEIIDQRRWTWIGTSVFGGMGTKGKLEFTRGTVAACWAIECAQPGDTVILVGFDNVQAGMALPIETSFAPEYRSEPSSFHFDGYLEGQQKYGNHDFAAEWPVMDYIAERRGVRLRFAHDEWA